MQCHYPVLPAVVEEHRPAQEAAEGEEEGPALQYRYPLLPGGVEEHRPAQELAEGEGEGRSPAHGPRRRMIQSK